MTPSNLKTETPAPRSAVPAAESARVPEQARPERGKGRSAWNAGRAWVAAALPAVVPWPANLRGLLGQAQGAGGSTVSFVFEGILVVALFGGALYVVCRAGRRN